MLLDPGFVAPGREIENDGLGKTTLTKQVVLVALRYRPSRPS